MIKALALVLMLAAPSARADVARFPLWDPYGLAAKISDDGYHMVQLRKDKRVLLDGKEVYRAVTPSHDSVPNMAAISGDGASWAVMRGEADESGAFRGVVLTINGKEIRRSHRSVRDLKYSSKGGNLAYIAQGTDGKWNVVSAQGSGPAFDAIPGLIAVGDDGILYNVDWQGRRWLYRDHAPAKGPDYHLLAATPDLAHVFATYKLGREFGASLDGAEFGRWPYVGDPLIDDKGRAAFFFSSVPDAKGWYDRLYVAGKTFTIPLSQPESPVFNSAGVFWRAAGVVYRDAEKIGDYPAYRGTWAAASPSGRRWAFLAGDERSSALIVDGRAVESGLPPPLFETRPVFDGEKALHYLGVGANDKAVLVCVTLDESKAARGACARKAAALKPAASGGE